MAGHVHQRKDVKVTILDVHLKLLLVGGGVDVYARWQGLSVVVLFVGVVGTKEVRGRRLDPMARTCAEAWVAGKAEEYRLIGFPVYFSVR